MDAGLVGELAHKTKHASTASETTSLPEQKRFLRFSFYWTHRIILVSRKFGGNLGLLAKTCVEEENQKNSENRELKSQANEQREQYQANEQREQYQANEQRGQYQGLLE